MRIQLRNIYYVHTVQVKRIFNFADNRVANLTVEKKRCDAHTDVRENGTPVSQIDDEEHSENDGVHG